MFKTNISILRSKTYNDYRNQPIMRGECIIERVEYEIALWLKNTEKGKYFSGVIKNDEVSGKIYLYENKFKSKHDMYGKALIGEDKYRINLLLFGNTLKGQIEYDDSVKFKELEEAKENRINKEKSLRERINEANEL
jgi:hypothetical protein